MFPTIYSPFIIFFLLITTAVAYTPSDYLLIDCGSSTKATSSDNRNWDGDVGSKFLPGNAADVSSASEADEQLPSVRWIPFMTSRLFSSRFTYTFPLSPGPKFLRLYFYSATYSGRDKASSVFSVTVEDDYTLLSNFSAFLTTSAKDPYLIKEFLINVRDNQMLNLTFTPSHESSYAFINGIEIVSVPENHYIRGSDHPVDLISSQKSPFYIDNKTTLETVYRLKVGGSYIGVTGDSGMFRAWSQDDNYIYGGNLGVVGYENISIRYTNETPNYTAPPMVYTSFRSMGNLSQLYNLSWYFPVDSGFFYLMRLHFCEILREVQLENQRVFYIYINNQTAEREADVIHWSGGNGIPVFRDYVVWMLDLDGSHSKQDLWLTMHPNLETRSQYSEALLNGLEIFKLNSTKGNLAGPNPEPVMAPPPVERQPTKNNGRTSRLVALIGGVIGGVVALLLILGFLIFWRGRRSPPNTKLSSQSNTGSSWVPLSYTSRSTKTSGSTLPSNLCRHFSLEEVKSAAGNFDDSFIIGRGGFGDVYKGSIDNGATAVAIKRLKPTSSQGATEFQTEIVMLSNLRHLHLVSLIGYCDDHGEMILVYEYMANGTLRDHLYKTKNPPLSWKQRLKICIGAARGLHYLHSGANRTIIHRDVKSTNILLDEKLVAKVADFGLSRLGPTEESQTHVSTTVKGSLGYLDPDYYKRRQLTEKSDVYSFGVVLFEVLCGRPAIIPGVSMEQVNLAEWAKHCNKKGAIHRVVDSNLTGQISSEALRKFVDVALSCLRENGTHRPGMNDVVWGLEFALQLDEIGVVGEKNTVVDGRQEKEERGTYDEHDDNGKEYERDVFTGSGEHKMSQSGSTDTSTTTRTSSGGDINLSNVFSQINNPTGR